MIYIRSVCAVIVCLLSFLPDTSAQTTYSLQKALQVAKENNVLLQAQQLSLNIAEADVITAKLRPNLHLNNQTLVLMNPSYYPTNTDWSSRRNQQVWWQLTKTFQAPGQRYNKIDFAQQNVLLTQKVYAATERDVFFDVANKWLQVWIDSKQMALISEVKENIDSLVEINKIRYRNQVISETDLMRTQLLSDQYDLQLIAMNQTYKSDLIILKAAIGINDSILVDLNDPLLISYTTQYDSLLEQALKNRADIQVQQATLRVAESNIKLQKSLAWPQAELGAIYNPQNSVPYVGFYGTVELPVFSRNQGEIKKSYVLKQQAERNIHAVQFLIRAELLSSYETFNMYRLNLDKYNSMMAISEKVLGNVRYNYLRGGTNIIDLLEAQRSWLDSQQQYNSMMSEYRKSYVQLLYSLGLINQIAQ
ncbi:MAG TPA: TolC family protein [Cytophaga sp.]|jgi:cobalt-zinc-cadmium efflux system outer membrane protein|nr:TolC family protein [Cytophaga sp.]